MVGVRTFPFTFHFDNDNWWTIGATSIKFVIQTHYKHTYKLCTKRCP